MYFTVGFEALHFYCVYSPEEKSEKNPYISIDVEKLQCQMNWLNNGIIYTISKFGRFA